MMNLKQELKQMLWLEEHIQIKFLQKQSVKK